MCSRVTCNDSNKPTSAGCGRHIEQALAGVPHDQRCKCGEGSVTTARSSLFSGLLGR
jgi:hypothetical protein